MNATPEACLEPVVELSPTEWAGDDFTPSMVGEEDWSDYWSDRLAAHGLEPILPGSWLVPAPSLSAPAVLARLIRTYLQRRGWTPGSVGSELVPMTLEGGFVVRGAGGSAIYPGCCCGLRDWKAWHSVLSVGPESEVVGVGHGDVTAHRQGDVIVIDEQFGDTTWNTVSLPIASLARGLRSSEKSLLQLADRLAAAASELTPDPEVRKRWARALIGRPSTAVTG